MKKTITIIMAAMLVTSGLNAMDKFIINGNLTANFSFDTKYKEVYGPFHLGADVTGAWNFFNHFFLWTGIGLVPAFAKITDLQANAFSWKLYFQLGLGYRFRLHQGYYINLHSGAVFLIYGERAMGISASEWSPGFEGGLDFQIMVKNKSFFSIFVDYIFSQTTFHSRDMAPGGLRIGIGIGRSF